METILQFLIALWEFLVKFCQIPIGAFIANFLISLLSAYAMIKFLFTTNPDLEILFSMQKIRKHKTLLQLSKQYIRLYSLITGFFSAVLVISQFKGVHLFMATACGVAGPYTLKDVMTKSFFSKPLGLFVGKETSEADKSATALYEHDLESVKKRLKMIKDAVDDNP